ncbi:MAG TPA: DUF5362 family protein [Opitutales bacterium]|jgi:hypothetical protein|nr:DUF5362 family protein [Opitutales bacterium]
MLTEFMANYFMQGGDGKEYGPVSAEQLRQWAAEGRANAQTKIRLAEGGPYMPLGTVPELNAGPGPAAAAAAPTGASWAQSSSSYFMLGGDGKEYGPVTAAQLRQWVAEGRANAQTQVRPSEGGPYAALGSVPALAAGAAVGATAYAGNLPLAHALAQNSGYAGTESSLQVKRLAGLLVEASGWMKFLAILAFISGVLTACSIAGIFICWIPIWIGIVLWKAADKAQEAAISGTEADLAQALDRLRLYFKIVGIYLVVLFVAGLVLFFLFFSAVTAAMAAVGGSAGMRGF